MAQRGATAVVVLGVKALICGWLVNHIGKVDVNLAVFLRTTGAAAGRAS
jgi:hemerythrin